MRLNLCLSKLLSRNKIALSTSNTDTTSMSTYEWVVQSKSKGDRFWKDLVDLPDTINGRQARTRLARYVNNNTDPDLEFRLIVRQETVIA
jgi:hypothetical protein